ncbi:MAG: glycosyltransferase family 4 protein [Bacteroidota bacterium]
MKILFLCNKSPYPPIEGGSIAMNALINGLIDAGHQVKVIAVSSNKFKISENDIPKSYIEKTGLELVYISLKVHPYAALVNLFSRKSYHAQRFIAKKFKKAITRVLTAEQFDIVQLETVYMGSYIGTIRKHSKAKIILRAHNIEHLIWQRIADETSKPLKRKYIRLLAARLRRFEAFILNRADGVAAISAEDAAYMVTEGCRVPITYIPFAIDTKVEPAANNSIIPLSLCHIGSMNWMPNESGIRWFLDNVWQRLHEEFPKASLYLAGRYMPEELMELKIEGLHVLGEVDDAKAFIQDKAIMIVPIFSGSGIRVKIIEGMWEKKAIISTSIGASGIQFTDEKNILIAENANEFLEKIRLCFNSSQYCNDLGENAHQLIIENYNNSNAINKLVNFYLNLIN